MKKNITIAIWFLGMVIVALMLFGCKCPQCDRPEFPLPIEKMQPPLQNLLHQESNIAYKSPTIKDYKDDDDINGG